MSTLRMLVAFGLILPLVMANLLLQTTKQSRNIYYALAVSSGIVAIFITVLIYNVVFRSSYEDYRYSMDWSRFSLWLPYLVVMGVFLYSLVQRLNRKLIAISLMIAAIMYAAGFLYSTHTFSRCNISNDPAWVLLGCISPGPEIIARGFPFKFYDSEAGIIIPFATANLVLLLLASATIVVVISGLMSLSKNHPGGTNNHEKVVAVCT
jgi:hypothetical protein